MPSDSSTLKDSDDLDLGWDDEPSSPSGAQAHFPAGSNASPVVCTFGSSRTCTVGRAAPLTPAKADASRPRYSLPPVSVAPRPGSSSPSSERRQPSSRWRSRLPNPRFQRVRRPRREFLRSAAPSHSRPASFALETIAPPRSCPALRSRCRAPRLFRRALRPFRRPAPVPSSLRPFRRVLARSVGVVRGERRLIGRLTGSKSAGRADPPSITELSRALDHGELCSRWASLAGAGTDMVRRSARTQLCSKHDRPSSARPHPGGTSRSRRCACLRLLRLRPHAISAHWGY